MSSVATYRWELLPGTTLGNLILCPHSPDALGRAVGADCFEGRRLIRIGAGVGAREAAWPSISSMVRAAAGDDREVGRNIMNRTLLVGWIASLVLGSALLAPGPVTAADAASYQAALSPVTANHVTGTGASWITVKGNTAEVRIQVKGLLDGAPHGQHLHIGGKGTCPSRARQHNGLPAISHADGAPFYGTIATSLTNIGDTSPMAKMAVTDFPSTGSYTYSRTIVLDPQVIANLRKGTAVLVVHGIDYNDNGMYDAVLGASELEPSVPAEATDPALCGAFVAMQMSAVPAGAANTGGGSTARSNSDHRVVGAVLVAALLAAGAWTGYRRRRTAQK